MKVMLINMMPFMLLLNFIGRANIWLYYGPIQKPIPKNQKQIWVLCCGTVRIFMSNRIGHP